MPRKYLKAHRTASSLRVKGGRGKLIGRDEHAVADAQGGAIRMAVTAGPVGDGTGAPAMRSSPPQAEWMPADRGYDVDWFRDA